MSNTNKMISHQYLIIVFLLTYLLTSCTPAKVDFSASQLNNLKYVFTDSNNKTNTVTLHPGDSSVLEFKTSDKISNSLQIKIQYQVVSPENQEVAKILNNYMTSKSIGIGEKTFTLPLEINSTLPFSGDAVMKISLSSEGDSVEITPSEYTLKIVNSIAPVLTPEISFNALTYVNLSNQVTYLISGSCANVTQFSLLVNASAYPVNCSSSVWTKIIDLSGFSDGALTLKASSVDLTVDYQSTTVTKDTVKPVITAINDSIFYNSITETPVITWSGSDATSGIQKYEIALGTSGSVQDKFPWTDIGAVLSKQLTGLSLTNGGTYYVQLRATDLAGNVGNVFTGDGYIVNTSMPVATLSGQPAALTNVSTYSITVGGSGIIEYKYKLGASSITDCSDPAGYSATAISTSVLISGSVPSTNSYRLCVVGRNNVDQWQSFSSATSYSWTFDNVLPSVVITSPSSGSFANMSNYSNFTVNASCSENGVTVNFQAENPTSPAVNTLSTGTCSAGSATAVFNLSTLQDGSVDIKAWQQDGAGNIGYASTVNIIKDTVAPGISGMVLLSTYNYNSTNFSPDISWNAVTVTEAGSGFSNYKLAIGTSPGLTNVLTWTNVAGSSYTAAGLVLNNGVTYYITFVAKDNAGNFSTALTASWSVDNMAPNVVITAPAAGSYIGTSNQASFTFSVSCETGLQVNFTITSLVDGSYATSSVVACSAGTATTIVDLSTYPNGNIQFAASQTDLAANPATANHSILKDTIAPTISGSISDGAYFKSLTDSPNLSWAGAMDSGSGVNIYQIRIGTSVGGAEIRDWMDIGNVTSFKLFSLALSEGTAYYPSVRAIDKAGNISTVTNGDGWIPDVVGPTPPTVVNDGDQWTSLTSSPPISWSAASDAASGIAKYEVRIIDSVSNPVSSWIDVGTATTYSFSGLSPLTVLNVYRAQVRATDNAGNVGSIANGDGWKIVDPGWKTESFLKAVNADSSDYFGGSVAIDGDTVVVGAYAEDSNQTSITNGSGASPDNSVSASGAVYVYKRTWNSSLKKYDWYQEAYLKASNANNSDGFGSSVAISNDTIVVGAYGEDSNQTFITNGGPITDNDSAPSSGAAYVFKRTTGSSWAQEAYLKASNANASDFFGSSVAISNDTIVVGAFGEDSDQTFITNGGSVSDNNLAQSSGAAYVFKRTGSTWVQEAYLKASNAEAWDNFGSPVAISNDTIVVGANGEDSNQTFITNGGSVSDNNLAQSSGAAYVFKRTTGSTWSQEAYLKASNAEMDDQFGFSVAISNDTIVVGAPFEDSNQTFITNGGSVSDNNLASKSGAAYVFKRTGSSWVQEAYLKAPNAEIDDQFGIAVAISNDTVVVGANLEKSSQMTITNGSTASSDNSCTNCGAAYVFHRNLSQWDSVAYIKAPNPSGNDVFGKFISISNNTLVVGVSQEDSDINYIQNTADTFIYNDNATDPGAAYIFKFDP